MFHFEGGVDKHAFDASSKVHSDSQIIGNTREDKNEEIFFNKRGKLFYFSAGEWKEKGVGYIQIIFFRRLKTAFLKIAKQNCFKTYLVPTYYVHQRISSSMKIHPFQNSDKAFSWFAENKLRYEHLCVCFKTADNAAAFKAAFEKVLNVLKENEVENITNPIIKSATSIYPVTHESYGTLLLPKADSWTCPICCANNAADKFICVACQTKKPASQVTSSNSIATITSSTNSNANLFTFDINGTYSVSSLKSTFNAFTFCTNSVTKGIKPASTSKPITLSSVNSSAYTFGGNSVVFAPIINQNNAFDGLTFSTGPMIKDRKTFSTSRSIATITNNSTANLFSFSQNCAIISSVNEQRNISQSLMFSTDLMVKETKTDTKDREILIASRKSGNSQAISYFGFSCMSSYATVVTSPLASLKPICRYYRNQSFVSTGRSRVSTENNVSKRNSVIPNINLVDTFYSKSSESRESLATFSNYNVYAPKCASASNISVYSLPLRTNVSLEGQKISSNIINDFAYKFVTAAEVKPIVSLPALVEVKPTEEEETLFGEQAKLLRFDFDEKEWKKYCTAELKILYLKARKMGRILMRTGKVCTNHYIFSHMQLTPLANNSEAWIWCAEDVSDGELKKEMFAAKFKNTEIAQEFFKIFHTCQSKMNGITGENKMPLDNKFQLGAYTRNKKVFDGQPSTSASNAPAALEGLTQKPKVSEIKSVPMPLETYFSESSPSVSRFNFGLSASSKKSDSSLFGNLKRPEGCKFQFNDGRFHRNEKTLMASVPTPSSTDDDEEDSFDKCFPPAVPLPPEADDNSVNEIEEVIFYGRGILFSFSDGDWEKRGTGNIKICIYRLTEKAPRLLMQEEKVLNLCAAHYFTSYMELHGLKNYDRIFTWLAQVHIGEEMRLQHFCVCFRTTKIAAAFKTAFAEALKVAKENEATTNKSTNKVKSTTNASPAIQKPFEFKLLPKSGCWTCPTCYINNAADNLLCVACETKKSGSQVTAGSNSIFVTTSTNNSTGTSCDSDNAGSPGIDGHDLEKKVVDDFKPLIPLPAEIIVDTGEENEVVLFEDRAKLHRFVDWEWKEWGIGTVKILHHEGTGQVRLLMRRDQVLKVCANHYITPDMEIHALNNSDIAWTWVAQDFADEELKPERFCIHFKTAEIAATFKAAFEKALSIAKENEAKKVTSPSIRFTTNASPVIQKPFGIKFLPKASSWTCPTCYVSNAADKLLCVACETKKPGSQVTADSHSISITTSTSNSTANQFTFVTNSLTVTSVCGPKNTFDVFTFSASAVMQEKKPDIKGRAMFRASRKKYKKSPRVTEVTALNPSPHSEFLDKTSSTAVVSSSSTVQSVESTESSTAGAECNISKIHSALQTITPANVFGSKSTESVATFASFSISISESSTESIVPTSSVPLFVNVSAKESRVSTDAAAEEFVPTVFKPVANSWECSKCQKSNMNESSCVYCSTLKSGTSVVIGKNSLVSGQKPLSELFKPDKSSWECQVCYVRNKSCDAKCVSCEFPKPSSSDAFNKNVISNNQNTQSISYVKNDKSEPLTNLFKPPAGSWQCQSCLIQNNSDADKCAACETKKPGSEFVSSVFPSSSDFGKSQFVLPVQSTSGTEKSSPFSSSVPSTSSTEKASPFSFGSNKPSSGDFGMKPITQYSTFSFGLLSVVGEGSKIVGFKPTLPTSNTPSVFSMSNTHSGSWQCQSCLIQNNSDADKCAACETKKPRSSFASSAFPSSSDFGKFQFGSSVQSATSTEKTSTFTFGSNKPSSGDFGMKPITQSTTFSFGLSSVIGKGSETVGFKPTLPASNTPAVFGGTTKKSDLSEKKSIPIPQTTSAVSDALGNAPPASIFNSGSPAGKEADSSSVEFRFGSTEKYKFNFSGVKPVKPRSPTKTPVCPKLLSTPSDVDEGDSFDADNFYFQPLPPKVDVKTGEENEKVMFCKQAKLFRFSAREWKERGIGDIKILFDRNSKKARLLMRRDKVLKVCLNHHLTKDIVFEWRGETSLTWAAIDFSENEASPELFAVRFKTSELAQWFKDSIDDALKLNALANESEVSSEQTSTATKVMANVSFTFSDSSVKIESPFSAGSLSACFGTTLQGKSLLGNSASVLSSTETKPCLSLSPFFQTEKLGTNSAFGKNLNFSTSSSKSIFGGHNFKFGPGSGAGDKKQVDKESEIEIVYEAIANPYKITEAKKLKLPRNFYLYESKPPCKGCRGCTDTISYKDASADVEKKPASKFTELTQSTPFRSENLGELCALFAKSVTFADLATNSSFESLSKPSSTKNVFAGAGTPLFSNANYSTEDAGASTEQKQEEKDLTKVQVSDSTMQKRQNSVISQKTSNALETQSNHVAPESETNEHNSDEESEEDDFIFEKRVSFEIFDESSNQFKIGLKLEKESEEVIFCEPAVLFCYTSREGNVRGVGDIKVLFNGVSKKAHLVMQKDHVLKVCLNDYLVREMSFEWWDDKSLKWAAIESFDNKPSCEIFAVQFETSALSYKFKEAIEYAMKLLKEAEISSDQISATTEDLVNFPSESYFSIKTNSPFFTKSVSTCLGETLQDKPFFGNSYLENVSEAKKSVLSPAHQLSLKNKFTASPVFTQNSDFSANNSKSVFQSNGFKFETDDSADDEKRSLPKFSETNEGSLHSENSLDMSMTSVKCVASVDLSTYCNFEDLSKLSSEKGFSASAENILFLAADNSTKDSEDDSADQGKHSLHTEERIEDSADEGKHLLRTEETIDDSGDEGKHSLSTEGDSADEGKHSLPTEENTDDSVDEGKQPLPTEESIDDSADEGKHSLPTEESTDESANEWKHSLLREESTDDSADEGKHSLPTEESTDEFANEWKHSLPTEENTGDAAEEGKHLLPTEESTDDSTDEGKHSLPAEESTSRNFSKMCDSADGGKRLLRKFSETNECSLHNENSKDMFVKSAVFSDLVTHSTFEDIPKPSSAKSVSPSAEKRFFSAADTSTATSEDS